MPRSTQNNIISNGESLGIVLGLGTSGVNRTLKQGIIVSDGGGGLADCSEAILLCPSGPTQCNETAQLTGSVIIGHEACKSAEVAAKLINNVVIGQGALESPTLQGGVLRDAVMIGHDAGHSATQVARYSTMVGAFAGDSSSSNSVTHSISQGVTLLGYKAGQLTSATQTLGDYAMILGATGSNSSSSANITDDSILIGRDTVCDGTTATGQIVIGSEHHNTTRIAGLLLNRLGRALDCPGSFHVSGVGAAEIRSVPIHPCTVQTDSGTASLMVDHGGGGTALGDPALSTDSRRRFTLGVRPEASSMQMYFPIVVPEGWKATAILVYITKGNDNSQMSVRIAVASRKIINIGQGSSASDYLTSHLALNNSNTSNALRTFATPYTPDGTTNCYLYVGSQSEHTIMTGASVRIERV
jgi:hypothetical protein